MKISEVIRQLEDIKSRFGDLKIVGGAMSEDHPPRGISVVDTEGHEVYPRDPNGIKGKYAVDGVFFE